MWSYIARRLLAFIPTFIIMVTVVFILTRLMPGDPAGMIAGLQIATEDKIKEIHTELGLDKSIVVQYGEWVFKAVQGNFGKSFFYNEPVMKVVLERTPITLSLALLSNLLTLCIAIPLGIMAASKRNTPLDAGVMVVSVFGVSLPEFWLGFIFILVFAVVFRWLPSAGYKDLASGFWPWLSHLILPTVALSLAQMALITRQTRTAMLEVLRKDYITTARAKGLGSVQVLYKHGIRNAMMTIVTVAGLNFSIILGGSVVIETVFGLPGVGRLIVDAAVKRDYPLIQGAVLYLIAIAMVINLLVDISYAFINPKVAYE
jgi:peptide/nickel transport system permease protein